MSLRQVWVRVQSLPPDNPLNRALAAAAEQEERTKRSADLDDALTRYRKG